MDLLECEEVADCRDGFLSSACAPDCELCFSRKLKEDVKSAFERIFRSIQYHSSVSFTGHFAKDALECLVDLVVSAHEGVKFLPLEFVHACIKRIHHLQKSPGCFFDFYKLFFVLLPLNSNTVQVSNQTLLFFVELFHLLL